jgi:aminoglycoside/choline kinase family phosphotransferase
LGKHVTKEDIVQFYKLWCDVLFALPKNQPTISMWDYHVDNIMVLQRSGIKRIGLLDYQDAMIAKIEYDIVSLLEDARRNVDINLRTKIIEYYLQSRMVERKNFMQTYRSLGLQRNMRILGVFSRKMLLETRGTLPSMIRRVEKYINDCLTYDADTCGDFDNLQNINLFLKDKGWIRSNA